jgi:hypothetical protein
MPISHIKFSKYMVVSMDEKELKRKRRAYFERGRLLYEIWELTGFDERFRPSYPPLPEELRNMRCGAKTRAGTPCKRKDIGDNGRCKLHGAMATGPRTIEGKKRSSLNGFIAKRKKRSP